jgi:hypothetical protein
VYNNKRESDWSISSGEFFKQIPGKLCSGVVDHTGNFFVTGPNLSNSDMYVAVCGVHFVSYKLFAKVLPEADIISKSVGQSGLVANSRTVSCEQFIIPRPPYK